MTTTATEVTRTIDTTAIESLFFDHWNNTTLPRGTGDHYVWRDLASLNSEKHEDLRYALQQVVEEYRSGTRWDSTRAAGSRFWHHVQARNGGRWTRTYEDDERACSVMGEWLHSQQAFVDGLPVRIPNPATTVAEWEPGRCLAAAYLSDGSLVSVLEVFGDGSVTAIDGHGATRTSLTTNDVHRITRETPLIVTTDNPDHLGSRHVVGSTLYMVRQYGTSGTRIYVGPNPNTGDHEYLGFVTLTNLRVEVAPAVVRPDRVRNTRQDGWDPEGRCRLVLPANNEDSSGLIDAYYRDGNNWRNAETRLEYLYEGEPLTHRTTGATGTYVGNLNDRDINVMQDGARVSWNREEALRVVTSPLVAQVDPVVEIDGVKYVPLSVVEKDLETMKAVIHKGADDNGLCAVYDKVMAKSDAATDFLKMGGRPRSRVVRMTRTVEVSWYQVVTSTSDDDARAQALAACSEVGRTIPVPSVDGLDGYRVRPGDITVTEVAM